MKYNVGDKVQIKSLDWYNENKDENGIVELSTHIFTPGMSQFCGKVMTIEDVFEDIDDNVVYYMEEIDYDWTDEMIECRLPAPKFQIGDVITDGRTILTILNIVSNKYVVQDNFEECGVLLFYSQDGWELLKEFDKEETYDFLEADKPYPTKPRVEDFLDMFNDTITLPEGFVFRDQNGNIIDATKIVLEKKKREYPKTYEECSDILSVYTDPDIDGYKGELLWTFQKLLICRDAYWKLYGEEMGLNRPWEPDGNAVYAITRNDGYIVHIETGGHDEVLEFPTAEMRDQFHNNFNKEIEICKNLL